MIVEEIKDKYNETKVWIIKSYPCGHYYLNQRNKGYLLNKRFIKVTKRFLTDLGLIEDSKVRSSAKETRKGQAS